jgi:hypothetical protein
MRLRAVALAAAFAACLPVPAHAATARPQITDAAGDQRAMSASYDIRSALFSTGGVTVRSGKRSVYVPTRLVVTVTYAAPVAADGYSAQVVSFATSDCRVYLEVYGTSHTYGSASCVDSPFTVPVKASGTTLTFMLPFSALGKGRLGPGADIGELSTWTNVAEPSQGYETGDLVGNAVTVDLAETDATYTIR